MTKKDARLELAKRKAKRDLYSFLLFMNYDFWQTRPEIKDIADYITESYINQISRRVSISTPPRFAKSTFANYLSAWLILVDRNNSIIRASYSQSLSTELNQGVRQIIDSAKFNGLLDEPLIFVEDTQIKLRLKGSHRACLYASSVGGSTTGFGGNILIADDLYKDHNEALSDTINNKTINWYHSAFASRLDNDWQLTIIIGTRWRNGELVDVLEQSDGYIDKSFKIKAMINGQSFNENVITTKNLLEVRSVMHKSIFESMYQQTPMIALNQLIYRNQFKTIDYGIDYNYSVRFAVLDFADTGSDNLALAIGDVTNGNVILRDLLTTNDDYSKTEAVIKEFAVHYNPTIFFIEDNKDTITMKKLAADLRLLGVNAKLFRTTKNKETKILYNAGKIQTMTIINNDDDNYNKFIDNVCKYDSARSSQHDDEIDCLAMLCEKISSYKKVYNYKIWE